MHSEFPNAQNMHKISDYEMQTLYALLRCHEKDFVFQSSAAAGRPLHAPPTNLPVTTVWNKSSDNLVEFKAVPFLPEEDLENGRGWYIPFVYGSYAG